MICDHPQAGLETARDSGAKVISLLRSLSTITNVNLDTFTPEPLSWEQYQTGLAAGTIPPIPPHP